MKEIFILFLLLAPALASVNLASDFVSTGENSAFSSYSEGVDHKISASAIGPVEYSMLVDAPSAGNSTVFSGINATNQKTVASFMSQSPEYKVSIKDARSLYATSKLGRERTVEFEEEVITEAINDSLVQITETVYTTSIANTVARGSGSIDEDVYMSYGGKARRLHLREFNATGNFSLNTSMTMNGEQTMQSFQVLNEPTKAFDKVVSPVEFYEEADSPMRV